MARPFKAAALAAGRAAADKKAEDVLVLHVGRKSPVADYLVLATALSWTHLDSLEKGVEQALEALDFSCLRRARPKSEHWRVLDFGGVVVHLMVAEARAFYALEKLYDGAPRLSWGEDEAAPKPRARKSRSQAGGATAR